MRQFTDANFRKQVLGADRPVLVAVCAPWTRPCLEATRTLEQLEPEYAGRAVIGMLNADENPATVARLRAGGGPAFAFVKDGQVHALLVGPQSRADLTVRLDALLADGGR